ncbi:MAG: flagellar hook capping protein [Planctomycetes bacterium]|nr:flagellar hook capping protein [Planctomycetota bacterium]
MPSIASLASLNAPAATPNTPALSTSGGPKLGQADFMKLLMAQMQHQNPLDPQSGTEYMSQLAQFSTLQGINQLNQNFNNMVMLQSLNQSVSLIGKTVTYLDTNGKSATGTVGSIALVAGQPQLVVNKQNVSLQQIQSVQAGPRSASGIS